MTGFQPGTIDYEVQANGFSRGRALSESARGAWQAAIRRHLSSLNPSWIVDLGSGTGRFSGLIAESLACSVIGVEPSMGMREEARANGIHRQVSLVGGNATAIPLASSKMDAVWMAYVVHHVADRTACAAEITRVLRPGGRALVVGAYSERRRDLLMFRYFEAGLRFIDDFPLVDEITADFSLGGLRRVTYETVKYTLAAGLKEVAARTAMRADTILQSISDREFAEGLQALEGDAAREATPLPIYDEVDLLVFERA